MSKAAGEGATPTSVEERSCGAGGQTARFTSSEKQILFALFLEHQHIIDIKCRKNGRTKKKLMSVRECWEKIVDEYNANPAISTPRNMKQVQKFWLNARLRKKYPFSSNANVHSGTDRLTSASKNSIKQEESLEIVTNENLNSSVEDVRSNDFISIDQISEDKLTLNDLLDFKNARPPREEVFIIREDPLTTSEKQDSSAQPASHSTRLPCSVKTPSVELEHEDPLHEPLVKDVDYRLNFFRLREAELRCKEQEILLQQKKLQLIRMRTEIKHMRELHQLQVESMNIKLRILSAEENNIKNKKDIS